MEDDGTGPLRGDVSDKRPNPSTSPPPPPNPHADADAAAPALDPAFAHRSDEPLKLAGPEWDITSISAVAALRMLIDALETLSDATGDVPATPAAALPTSATPRPDRPGPEHGHSHGRVIGADAPEHSVQHAAIARRFFSKVAPPFSLADYLTRLHHWCPHSPGVYLAAALYCHRLCVVDGVVPATKRTVHRLALAAIRIAAKALEDNKWSQDRIAKVGGVSHAQLMNLEVSLCFLLDFELWVEDDKTLAKSMFLLQQAARQGVGVRGRLSEFKLRLPMGRSVKTVSAAA